MTEEQHHLKDEMKNEITKACQEKEKIAEGKKAYDAKRPSLKAEIEAKAKAHEKLANEIAEGKKEFDKKRPSLQAEIAKKAQAHEKIAQEIEKGKKEFDAKKGELFKEIEKKVAKKK